MESFQIREFEVQELLPKFTNLVFKIKAVLEKSKEQ